MDADARVRHLTLLVDFNCFRPELAHRVSEERRFTIVDDRDFLVKVSCMRHSHMQVERAYVLVECRCLDDPAALNHLVSTLLPGLGDLMEVPRSTEDAQAALELMSRDPAFAAMPTDEWFSPDTFEPFVDPSDLHDACRAHLEIVVVAPEHPAALAAAPGAIVRGVRARRAIPAHRLLTFYDEGGILVCKGGPDDDGNVPDEIKMYMMGHPDSRLACIGSPLGQSFGPLLNSCSNTGRRANAYCLSVCIKSRQDERLFMRNCIVSRVAIGAGEEVLLEYGAAYDAAFLGVGV